MASEKRKRRLDLVSTLTMALTIFLFIIAIFEKGFTHELLLEAGVFLVSLKLILSSAKAQIATESIEAKLNVLLEAQSRDSK